MNSNIQSRRLKLKRQRKGGEVVLTLTEDANLVQETLEALLNMRILVPTTDGNNSFEGSEAQIDFAEGGLIITMPPQLDTSTPLSGGSQIFSQDGPPSATTLALAGMPATFEAGVTPSVYIDATNNNIWFCTTAGTAATSAWTQINTGGSSTDQLYVITAVNQNTITAGGFTIYKPLELQGGLQNEKIDNVTISYGNYSPDFNTRIATDPNSNSYTQYINPRYTVGQIICARAVSTLVTATFPSGTGYPLRAVQSTFLLEYSPSRNWGGTP
jgi:hypothetical protein